jgi:hypothetical protein
MSSYIFGIVVALLLLIVVIEMLRRGRLRERHAIWWLVAGVLALVVGAFPQTLTWASDLIGIEIPLNLVFFVSIAILFLVSLQHSAEVTELEAKTRSLAEEVALMRMRMQQMEAAKQPTTPAPPTGKSRRR